jgi:hypothetical protein
MYSYTKPISINKPTKIKYSFNDTPNDQTFIFELFIKYFNNNNFIRKIEKTKYCDILLENNNVNYSDIEYFELKVIDLINNKEYYLKDNFNNKSFSYSKNDNNLYIEFSHNSFGIARATCYIIGIDLNSYIISPPN